ncbi:kinase-like protein [Heliocybe sulcata]|uniref:Kinase-like protein n=1 Tax=Heliocybe sulcata TaxID=5364 RepID=A0A5C3NKJ0_9AGAM|nr:kinase-like protein [Heliocybe sulcata]
MVDSAPKAVQRTSGFRRVRDQRDLRPNVNPQPVGRRMDSDGNWLSPLRQLTTNLVDTFHICNPQFRYESAHNPRRVLTKPSKPSHNDGYDNEDYDYILYVNDWLGAEEGHNRYLILDVLGQGTFGQVVKCQNMKTHEIVAVKVVKNKPAYFNQSMMEVTILELLNNQCDPNDEHHILRLRDSFIHKNHLCLVFELLSSNLYELIKQNQFQGLSTQLVKVFAAQLLDSLTVLKEARLIHCDLKPENILLKSLSSPQIKVIDFGSACHERQTVYTYIQSRFYRSPEVLLGNPYTAAIDMWSLGCIVVELFLGLPLFPGTSEYNQITRIVDMLGMPPAHMLEFGKQTNQFFDSYIDMYGQKKYRLKSIEQYSREHNTQEQPGKQYFKHTTLPDIVNNAPVHNYKSSSRGANHEHEKEMANRASFIDFCHGLLNLDPVNRWTPQQARQHPFITGEKWTGPWQPSATAPSHSATPPAKNPTPDPKRPYGGLVPSQPKGQRAYQDAASYNQQLAQHQAYTAQAATQAANSAYARNPYMQPSTSQPSSAYASPPESANPPFPQPQTQFSSQNNGHGGSAHQTSHGHLAINTSVSQYPSHGSSGGSGANVSGHLEPGPPAATYYPTTRARANTVNQIDVVPPALARLRHMTQDVIGGRNALTPVLNREDALKEWERRQSGKAAAAQPYPQLEHLHQQAELAGSGGLYNWGHASTSARYHPPGTSKLAQSYHPAGALVDDDRRDAIMSNVRSAARGDSGSFGGSASNQNYSGSGSSRYAPASYSQAQSPTSPFDSLERRTDIGTLYVPMQPDQYQPYPSGGTGSQQQRQPAQNIAPSFYSGGVVAAGQPSNGVGTQRNPFGAVDGGQGSVKDSRRHSGMDVWPR